MLKNKKSLMLANTVVRIVLTTLAIVLLIVPISARVIKVLLDSGSSVEDFEEFVDGINEMPTDSKNAFSLELDDKSAIIGFDKSEGYTCEECINCIVAAVWKQTMTIARPSNPECTNSACVCLCDNNFGKDGSLCVPGEIASFKCEEYLCKALNTDISIVGGTLIKKDVGTDVSWKNGFSFLNVAKMNLLADLGANVVLNGLEANTNKQRALYVEKSANNVVGVCNQEMLDYNKEELGLPDGACINLGSEVIPVIEISDTPNGKARIKYQGIAEKDTTLEFNLVNRLDHKIQNVKIVSVVPKDCYCCADAKDDGNCNNGNCCSGDDHQKTDIDCGNMASGDSCHFKHTNFCLGPYRFSVAVGYTDNAVDKVINYELDCAPNIKKCDPNNQWYVCTAT